MNPVTYIRLHVFDCKSQRAFAEVVGVSQVTISRWENWGRIPGHKQSAVRAAAVSRDLPWDDRWFFEAPQTGAAA